MKNVLVVSNFNAGRKKALKYKKTVINFLIKNSNKFKFISVDEIDYIDLTDYDTIIAMGGDGTINRVLPYVFNTDKTLGIIPCGTANLLASRLKIPTNIKKAIDVLKNGSSKAIDTMQINNKLGILRLGIGFDADIICKTPQSVKNRFGYFAYFVSGCLFALRLKNKKYKFLINDSEEIKETASCIIVANSPNMWQNMVSVGHKSNLDDGLLDIFVLKTQNPIIFFIELLSIVLKIKITNKRARYLKANSIKIQNKWCYAHLDGEKIRYNEDIHIKVHPKSIKVLAK